MDKKYWLSAFLFCIISRSLAQEIIQNTDELHRKYVSQNDTAALRQEGNLARALNAKNFLDAARASYELGSINYDRFRYDESIFYSLKGIEFARNAGDLGTEVANLLGLGYAYFNKSNYALSMEYSLRALKLSANLNDPQTVMRINNRIGMVYKYVEDYERAKTYFMPAYEEALRLKKGPLPDLLINLGNVEEGLGNFKEGIDYYQKYLLLRPGDRFLQVIGYNNIGKVYVKLNELDKAWDYFKKAYEVEDTAFNPRGRAYSFNNFALVEQGKGNYGQAIAYGTRSLDLSIYYKMKSLQWNNYSLLADCYQRSGNYLLANQFLGKYVAMKDSIFTSKRIDRINVLEAAYKFELETGKKQRQIESLNKEGAIRELEVINLRNKNHIGQLQIANLDKEKSLALLKVNNLVQKDSLSQLNLENYNRANLVTKMQLQNLSQENKLKNLQLTLQQRNLWLIVSGSILSLIAFIYFYRRYRLKKLLEIEKMRSDLAADFHDELGSTLSSIALYSEMAIMEDGHDPQRVRNVLSMIGESSRGMVVTMQDMIWTIQPENDSIGEIVFRMKEYAIPLAEMKKIELEIHAADNIINLQPAMDIRKNIYLIFKEAVNNAFKYSGASRIVINFYKHDDFISLLINDNGEGFNVNRPKPGNGLKNLYKRAEQCGGKVIIKSGPGTGTEIFFQCPVP